MIGVPLLYILVESALFGTRMVKKWTRILVLVIVALMNIWGIFGLWGIFSIVFLEVYAILMCCKICLDKGYRNKCIYRCSDNHTALLALCKNSIISCIIWQSYSLLFQLAAGNNVTLYWVPAYCDIPGNEIADELARNGSSNPFAGPELATLKFQLTFLRIWSDIFRRKLHLN